MKKIFIHYIKLCFALILFLQVGKVSGQTVTISGAFPQTISGPLLIQNPCGDVTGAVVGAASFNDSGTVTATSSSPVTHISFLVASIGGTSVETHFFDAVGITNEIVSIPSDCSGFLTVNGLQVSNTLASYSVVTRITVSSTTPFTKVNINYTPGQTAAFVLATGAIAFNCAAGTTAPSLSAFTVSNVCPATTANLNSLLSSSATAAQVSMLKWYTDAAHTTAVADATQAPAGTYYAFYYDAANNCYSPASGAVTATVTLCPVNISNTCPASSVDLALSLASTNVVPSGYTLTYHSGTPATTANKLTSSVVTTAGTYYGAYYLAGQQCYTATGRPLVVTFTDCCAAKIAPDLTN